MASNPFKSFIPYNVKIKAYNDFPNYPSVTDPSGGQATTIGFADLPNAERLWETEAGRICAVQINERLLPAAVVKEEVVKRCDRLAEQQGHKVSKADRAAIKDQVEFDLLAKAFIKRTTIYVAFYGRTNMLVFTSSQRRADQVVAFLADVSDGTIEPRKIETERQVGGWLTSLAHDSDIYTFFAGESATLVGEDGRAANLKKIAVEGETVQDLLQSGYTVTSMKVIHAPTLEKKDDIGFTLTDKFIFKGFSIDGVKSSQAKEDFEGFAVLHLQAIKKVLKELMPLLSEEEL